MLLNNNTSCIVCYIYFAKLIHFKQTEHNLIDVQQIHLVSGPTPNTASYVHYFIQMCRTSL